MGTNGVDGSSGGTINGGEDNTVKAGAIAGLRPLPPNDCGERAGVIVFFSGHHGVRPHG